MSAINILRRLIPIHPRALIDSLLTYPRFLGTIKPQLLGRADAELGARIRSLGTAWWPRALKCPVGSECLLSPLLHATGSKKTTAAAVVAAEGRFPMKTVAEVIGVSRSNLAGRLQERSKKRIGRPPLPDDELVPRSRRSSPSCRPTAIGGSTPFSSGRRWLQV